MTRQEVFELINEERAYQDSKWNASVTDTAGIHSDIEFIVFIENYLEEAKRVFSRHPNPFAEDFVKHTLRKIATLAVASMEQNGGLSRIQEGPRPVGYEE